MNIKLIEPNWQVPEQIKAFSTTRIGGFSKPPFKALNLGLHVGDSPYAVELNRSSLQIQAKMPAPPVWLNQVHGNNVIKVANAHPIQIDGDASVTSEKYLPLVIMTADCLPVLLTDKSGNVIAAVHCGWRSLAANILTATLTKMSVQTNTVIAWLGPCISERHFEVGQDVVDAFVHLSPQHQPAFVPHHKAGKYLCDLRLIATKQLQSLGVTEISQSYDCTYQNQSHFFSYRRDGQTGRMATCIWIS